MKQIEPQTRGGRRDEQRLETILGNLLRAGVIAAAVVVTAGGVLYLVRHGHERPDFQSFKGEPAELCGIRGIVGFAWEGRARGIIQLGLLMLVATPVLRVAFSVVAFALQRDRKYVLFTLIVLTGLLWGFFGGFR